MGNQPIGEWKTDSPKSYSCLLAGATGLVGSALLRQLLIDPTCHEITVLARRPLEEPVRDANSRSKLRVIIVDFDHLEDALDDVQADIVFCTLGTTIKVAGSQEAFRKVDYDYPLALARWAELAGVKHYMIITAMGSSTSSPFFYSRVKGELEEQLVQIPVSSLHLFQPSLLLGQRSAKRRGESIGAVLSKGLQWMMVGPLRKYRAITGENVARAMRTAAVQAAQDAASDKTVNKPIVYKYESDQIAAMAVHTTR